MVEGSSDVIEDADNTDWTALKLPEARKRDNLVLVRSGNASLHRQWPQDINDGVRNWDLMLSHWDTAAPSSDEADIVIMQKATKFNAFARLYRDIPWLSSYKAVWLCDDDIMTSWSNVQYMFDLFHGYDLLMAQPGLSAASYGTHRICYASEDCLLRYTNFVEPMVPLFSAEGLKICLPVFDEDTYGFEFDWAWRSLLRDTVNRIAILDAAQVTHTRPVGCSANYDHMTAKGDTFRQRMDDLLRKYNISDYSQLEQGYILKNPREARSERHVFFPDKPHQLDGRLEPLLLAVARQPIPAAWRNGNVVWEAPHNWKRGARQEYQIPALAESDWCMSVGFTFFLWKNTKNEATEIIRVGKSDGTVRFSVAYITTGNDTFQLNITLPGRQLKTISFALTGMCIGKKIDVCMQFYGGAGWTRLWRDGVSLHDMWSDTIAWYAADRMWVGSNNAECEINNLWLSPTPAQSKSL